jgi:hypothetical protein
VTWLLIVFAVIVALVIILCWSMIVVAARADARAGRSR